MLFLLAAHCSVLKKKPEKNVFLITLDTQRADFLSAYSSKNAQTPHLDFFASQGTLYENAYSLIPITVPAHAAIFYSMQPHKLGIFNNGQIFTPPDHVLSTAEIFQKQGFKTAAFISLGVLQSKFHLNHGFSEYHDRIESQRWYLHAEEVNKKVFSWLDHNSHSRLFIWVHYSDPHDPYAPPDLPADFRISINGKILQEFCVQTREKIKVTCPLPTGPSQIRLEILNPFPAPRDDFRISLNDIEFLNPRSLPMEFKNISFISRGEKRSLVLKKDGFIQIDNPGEETDLVIKAQGNINLFPSERIEAYRQETEYLDKQIGALKKKLESMNLLDKSILVFIGDHGEGLGDYITGAGTGEYYFGHIHYLKDVYMKIPLIIWDSSQTETGVRIKDRVSLLDVAPTLMAMMGWKKMPFHEGRDLNKLKNGAPPITFQATYAPEAASDRFASFDHPWHLIFTPSQRSFELYNVELDPQEQHDIFKDFQERAEWRDRILQLQRQAAVILKNKSPFHMDEKTLEMLKSLGYIK